MRTAFILAAVALASGAAADPQPTASEIFALRTECGKIGEEWKNRLIKNVFTRVDVFYSSKTNRCWVIATEGIRLESPKPMIMSWASLIDAQTGRSLMQCPIYPKKEGFEAECAYMKDIQSGDLEPDVTAQAHP